MITCKTFLKSYHHIKPILIGDEKQPKGTVWVLSLAYPVVWAYTSIYFADTTKQPQIVTGKLPVFVHQHWHFPIITSQLASFVSVSVKDPANPRDEGWR